MTPRARVLRVAGMRPAVARWLVVAAGLAACTSGAIVAPAHAIKAIMPATHLVGTLSVQNGCPLLDDGTGPVLPIWPQGANVTAGTLRMRDAPVSRVGEAVRVGGHWIARDQLGKDLLAPLPPGCSGTGRVFWVQTFEFELPGSGADATP